MNKPARPNPLEVAAYVLAFAVALPIWLTMIAARVLIAPFAAFRHLHS
jgi:hypothetical protein